MRIYSSIDFAASVVICSGRLFFWKKFRMKPIQLIDWFIWTTDRSARIPSKIRSEICLISGWLLLLCPLHWRVLFTKSSKFHSTVVKRIFCLLNRSNEYDVWLSVRRLISSFISRYEESNGFLFAVIGWIVTKWPHVEYFNFGTKCINIWNKKNVIYILILSPNSQSFRFKPTLIVVRNFSAVASTKRRQSSVFGGSKTPSVVLSMTISMPSNDCCTSWLKLSKLSKSSLSKMLQWWTEVPGDFGELRFGLVVVTPLAFLFFTRITWQLCFEDRFSANSWDSLDSPFVIYLYRWKESDEKLIPVSC